MKRILSGVHVLMAIGLALTLAACGGSDGNLKRERDEARAAAEAAAAAQAAAEAAKAAADAAAAQAAADKAAAEAAQAEAEAAKAAADAALAQAEADKQALEDQLAGAPKTLEQLEAELAAADEVLTAANEAKAAADMALEMATAAREAAQTAVDTSAPEDLTDAIAALQAAREAETAAMAEAMTAAEAATQAQEARDAAHTALTEADTGPSSEQLAEDERKADVAGARLAFALLDSIPVADDDTTADVDESLPRRETATSLKVSHDGMDAKFSATMTVTDTTANTARTSTVFSATEENSAPSIPGWFGASLSGKKGGNDADAVVYSNIEPPEDKLFAVEYGATVELVVTTGTTPIAATNANWQRANIPPANKYSGGTAGGSIDGTFRGVPGTFTCEGAACPAAGAFPVRRSDGSIVGADSTATAAIAGTSWEFEPTDEAAVIKVADSDYTSFGYWLSKDKGDPVGFGVWYGGSAAVAALPTGGTDPLATLDEKVDYKGVAGGKYVVKDDVANTGTAGYFTANAELTADFTVEGTTVAGTVGSVTGTIDNFMDGDSTPLGDLSLALEGNLARDTTANTLTVTANDATPADNTSIVEATSGGLKHGAVGVWEAQFFGRDKTTNVPTGVAGAFNATIGDEAVVVGGFGAARATE